MVFSVIDKIVTDENIDIILKSDWLIRFHFAKNLNEISLPIDNTFRSKFTINKNGTISNDPFIYELIAQHILFNCNLLDMEITIFIYNDFSSIKILDALIFAINLLNNNHLTIEINDDQLFVKEKETLILQTTLLD